MAHSHLVTGFGFSHARQLRLCRFGWLHDVATTCLFTGYIQGCPVANDSVLT